MPTKPRARTTTINTDKPAVRTAAKPITKTVQRKVDVATYTILNTWLLVANVIVNVAVFITAIRILAAITK